MTLIAVTGWGQQRDVRQATEAGFNAHLTKPVEPDVLDNMLAQPHIQPSGA
jgi:CheY-like chemotaxis protein